MEREERSRGRGMGVFLGVGSLLMVPVLYVLSVGPAVWLFEHKMIGGIEFLETFYAPLQFLSTYCPPFEQFMAWYQSLFGL